MGTGSLRDVNRLAVLYQASQAISASLDADELYLAVHHAVERVMVCEDFIIDIYDESRREVQSVYLVERPGRHVIIPAHPSSRGLVGYIVQTRAPILLNSPEEIAESGIILEPYGTGGPTSSILAAPLLLRGKVLGMLSVQAYRPNAYDMEDLELLSMLCAHVAVSLENVRLFAEIQHLASVDTLTDILNRRKFFELAEREFVRANRYPQHLTAIMLDIDHFKRVNDTFGHKVGDLVLRVVADGCKRNIREMDILGRYGGEEFAIVMPETPLMRAVYVAERLRMYIEQSTVESASQNLKLTSSLKIPQSLRVTISLGVAALDASCIDLDVLLDHADQAMYVAKREGRNCVRVWDSQS